MPFMSLSTTFTFVSFTVWGTLSGAITKLNKAAQMLPSNTNVNTTTSVSYTSPPLPFFIDITPNSKQEDPLLSLFHFPSPFLHYDDDAAGVFFPHHHDLLHLPPKQQPLLTTDINTAAHEALQVNNMFDSTKNSSLNEIMGNSKNNTSHRLVSETPRKRSSKRDRHSKINTAQGPRDRRMRLSLDIARQFFDLQDMLGYDKASKTVEWLLSKAKAEIKKLRGLVPVQMKGSCSVGCTTKSASSTSEGEVVSGLIDEAAVPINGNQISKVLKPSTSVTKEKRTRQSRKGAFHTLAKESREKARARARERTKEKKMWSSGRRLYESTANQDLNQVGNSWSPFEESGSQSHNNMNPLMEVLQADQVEEPNSHEFEGQQLGNNTTGGDMGDESLASIGKWSPSPILHYLHNSPGIFQEVSSNKKFSDLPNIDSARTYTTSSYCATTSMHLSITGNDQDGIPNSNFLTGPYDCLQHQFADFDDQF